MELKKELSIVVPVYNEKNAILSTINQIIEIMDQTDIIYQLIIVNDGSKDGTKEILEDFFKNFNNTNKLKIVHHNPNRGYGASLKTGIFNAIYDNVCITDADATYPNDMIPILFDKYLGEYDMVVGQRQFKKLPMITKPAKWFISSLANFLVDQDIKDINSGLRIFNKQIAIKFFPMICDGFSFTTTITLAMMTNSYRVMYHPIEYYKREGKSKIRPIRDTLNFISLIIRTVMYFNPMKIFTPLAFLMWTIAFILFFGYRLEWLTPFLEESPGNTISVFFVGGIQIFITGLIADLIDKRVQK